MGVLELSGGREAGRGGGREGRAVQLPVPLLL